SLCSRAVLAASSSTIRTAGGVSAAISLLLRSGVFVRLGSDGMARQIQRRGSFDRQDSDAADVGEMQHKGAGVEDQPRSTDARMHGRTRNKAGVQSPVEREQRWERSNGKGMSRLLPLLRVFPGRSR